MELIFGPKEGHGVKELGQKSPGLLARVGGAPTPLGVPLPRGQPGTLLAQLFCSKGFFWSIKNQQKLARQLDSVWYSFSVELKNKQKTGTGTGLYVNRLVPKIL